MQHTAYLLLGSNIGDRLHYLQQAILKISQTQGITLKQQSEIYETAAWGLEDMPAHLNMALCVHTTLSAHELLHEVLRIELELDRARQQKWGARTMDIDIIFYDNDVIQTEALVVPHPWMQDRRFVLVPMAEIAAEYLHPVYHKTVAVLLEATADQLPVNIYTITKVS